ncbi:MAG: hypothetical protein KA371_07520 [Acidobacteria bacterium]|nr:hypothetical protein [Acidobacteriota bacterium]
MPELDELSLQVLRLLSARLPGSGFEMLTVEGEPDEAVSAIVERLRFDHLVDAAFIEHGFGTTPDHWAPSSLTEKGRRVLASLDSVVCPTCFQPMRLTEAMSQDDGANAGGRLFECSAHGEWYQGPNAGFLRRRSG